jgi:ATP-dependent exoDNAse (exonuclease V) alpha subunit
MCTREFADSRTVHAAFGFGLTPAPDLSVGKCRAAAAVHLRTLQPGGVVVVDEAGMMAAEQFDMMLLLLGGMPSQHIVLVGDLNQTPPISGNPLPVSRTFASPDTHVHVLREQYRSLCPDLSALLSDILHRRLESAHVVMRAHMRAVAPAPDVNLVFKRDVAAAINAAETRKLVSHSGPAILYVPENDDESTSVPAPFVLTTGTPVLFTTNRFKRGGIMNGTQGKVVGFDEKYEVYPIVRLCGTDIDVLVPVVHGTLPIAPAHAITVHRSQGTTITGSVCVDVNGGREFAPGLLYVALSRVRSLEALQLRNVPCAAWELRLAPRDPRVVDWCAAHGV